jgi:hypothetical protein
MRYLILLLTAISAVVWADDTTDSAQSRLTYINNNTIYIDQVGNSNTNVIQQNSSQASIAGVGANSLPIQGDGNTVTLKQGDPGGSGQHLIEGEIYGSYNTVTVTQGIGLDGQTTGLDAGGHYLLFSVTGTGNQISSEQTNTGSANMSYVATTVNGNYNTQTFSQTGNGAKQITANTQGNLNTLTATQIGSQQNLLVNMLGNGNSANVLQTGSANSANISITNAGGPGSVNLIQTGGQSYSVSTVCVQAGGCGPITVRQGN